MLALSAAAGVEAQSFLQRALPLEQGKLGRLGEPAPWPIVQINGDNMKLAPGGVIFDENNRTIVQGALPPHARVLYTTDMNGDVQRIYILTPAEQEMLRQARKR